MQIKKLNKWNFIKWRKAIELIQEEIYDDQPLKIVRRWAKSLRGNSPFVQWFIAEIKREVIGVLRMELYDLFGDNAILMQSWIAVEEEYQRKGIGSTLLKEGIQRIKKDLNKFYQKKVTAVWVEYDEWEKGTEVFYRKHYDQHLVIEGLWKEKDKNAIFAFQRVK